MKVLYHPAVQRDVDEALRYYRRISMSLGDDLWSELAMALQKIAEHPERYHFYRSGLRRLNLGRFPYHILFRVGVNAVKIVVVRHHRRHPNYGIDRR